MAKPKAQFFKRQDWQFIAELIAPGAKVLDIGCSDGALLSGLKRLKKIDARGMELSQDGVNRCVAQGLAVIQGNADTDLAQYPTRGFDYAILSQTLQAMQKPQAAMRELARLAHNVVVAIPNFGHWRIRCNLLLGGRMPKNRALPAEWYNTPNIHLCTLRDFAALCAELNLVIDRSIMMQGGRARVRQGAPTARDNWCAEEAVFLVHRRGRALDRARRTR